MNYGVSIAADAMADLQELDVWLQEEVLDELEHLVSVLEPQAGTPSEMIHDFERIMGKDRHVIFVRLLRDEQNLKLVVLGLGQHSIPTS